MRSPHPDAPVRLAPVLLEGFPAGAWGTNCYVLAPGSGAECLVVDPGHEAEKPLGEVLRANRLKPVAVLLTHGHVDHMFSVVPVCGTHEIPAYVHPADRPMLADPALGLGVDSRRMLGGLRFTEPDDVVELTGHDVLDLAGLEVTVDHTPGHTTGSVTFRLGDEAFLSGDLLFRDSIGRMDLPGGDEREMFESLERVVMPLPDELPVYPGHGPRTTIGREKKCNPFLPRRGL
jgi:hydroxyacylglutathione hydrolase